PHSQLILYPKYPEVRFSGFLLGCENAPSDLMTKRIPNRLLFFSVANNGAVLGYVTSPNSELAREFLKEKNLSENGVFTVLSLFVTSDNRQKLLWELKRIHNKNWIISKRLDKSGNILPCVSSNCGGYTLEAELGITPNGYSEPDFLGWEIKQFGVPNFNRISNSTITLMTPEPTGGLYVSKGVESFIRQYGYDDLKGRADRKNFGGVHKTGVRHSRTKLKMELIGFNKDEGKIRNSNGMIALVDIKEKIVASWSFTSMLLHWNRKHNRACYVPSISEKSSVKKYWYGNTVILGKGTDFQLFLQQMALGNIYYDPGIKMENYSSKPIIKRRSQFRLRSGHLSLLYKESEFLTF
ncbi:MAG TPA: MvaI/BcnI family restriction endonuclease, partial [Bacteroidia bacterium]